MKRMNKANLIKERLTVPERRKLKAYVKKDWGNLTRVTVMTGYSIPTIKGAINGNEFLEEKINAIRSLLPTLN